MPARQPGGALPTREFPGEMPARPSHRQPQQHLQPQAHQGTGVHAGTGTDPGASAGQPEGGLPGRRAPMPSRPSVIRPPRPAGAGGRHRRPVPASLPQSAPALVIAVPGSDTDLTSGAVGELAAVLRVDNPAVEVRAARIDGGGHGDPSDIRSVLADAAARRPEGAPCAVVIPLIATPNPPLTRRLRQAVAASEVNAIVSGFTNSNALIAEVLHIRLAEAGLARADRVRLFSIVTAAEGVLVATVGGPDAAMAANVTSVLLAARLALPVIAVSLDSAPSVVDGAVRLKDMGVNRLAIAPCFIGPEAGKSELDAMAALPECAAPLGAHGNIAKLTALTYGHVISRLEELAEAEAQDQAHPEAEAAEAEE